MRLKQLAGFCSDFLVLSLEVSDHEHEARGDPVVELLPANDAIAGRDKAPDWWMEWQGFGW